MLNLHPSGLLTEEQVSILNELQFKGVPTLTSYSGVYFAVMEEEDEVVTFPLEMISATTDAFARVLRVVESERMEEPAGSFLIEVTVSFRSDGNPFVFRMSHYGRQLLMPQHALIEIQNQMRSSADDLDERLIHQLLSVDYPTIIHDGRPSIDVRL
jgi:hypothetical protein